MLLVGLASCAFAATELIVKQDQAPLYSQCFAKGMEVARLAKGQTVRLRFAIAGSDNRCYYVSAEVDGKTLNGYVPRNSLAGLEDFEQTRRQASSKQMVRSAIETLGLPEPANEDAAPTAGSGRVVPPDLLRAAAALQEGNALEAERLLTSGGLPASDPDVALVRARALLQLTRPSEALEAVLLALESAPDHPSLLALAGLSSLQRDDRKGALDYFKRSLDAQPNPSIEALYRKVERELASDKSQDTSHGSRFVLRYEGEALDPAAAQRLTAMFEREISRISYELGCPMADRLPVIVQSRENYRNATGAADWSGGHYDGRVRIVVPPTGEVTSQVQQVFAHEFTHACLARRGNWPLWLHEGLAQRMAGGHLESRQRQALGQLARADHLPRLTSLGNNWSALKASDAAVAYSLSLAAVELFFEEFRAYGIRNLMNNPDRLPGITADLDKRLRETLR